MPTTINGTTGVSRVQDEVITSPKIVDGSISAADLSGNQTGSAPIYGVRAWCRFNGTLTGTNAPVAGGNVTSVTRNAAGDYTINFTTQLPSANYALMGMSRSDNTSYLTCPRIKFGSTPSTSSVSVETGSYNTVNADQSLITVCVIG